MSNITKPIILDETGARIAEALETMAGGGSSAKAESIASPYYPTKTYDVGEKCTYNGKYYKCIVQITTAEEWDVTHWEETTVEEQLNTVKSDLTSIDDDVQNIKGIASDTDSKIAQTVAGWCSEHIIEDPTVVIDNSLSVEGAAADANAAGSMQGTSFSKYNILPPEKVPTGTVKTVVISRTDDVFTFDGTATGTDSNEGKDLDLVPGEKYTARVYTTSNKNINASIRYRKNGTETNLGAFGATSNGRKLTFTCPAEFDGIYVKLGVNNGVAYDSSEEFKISIALGESNPSYVKYGEGKSAFDGFARKNVQDIQKEIKEVKNFVTPEMFGAIGDGSANDTDAINACFAYAKANGLPMFGTKTYRVRQAITFEASGMYVYLYTLTSSDAVGTLLTIKGSRNKIIIDNLIATGTSAKALCLYSSNTITTNNNYFQFIRIVADGNAMYLYGDDTGGIPNYISYNAFMLKHVKSENGNAIHQGNYVAENEFYNAKIVCPNGWAIYNPTAMRCFGFALENDVLNGIYVNGGGGFTFFGFRHIDMTDKLVRRLDGQQPSAQGGTLIKIDGPTVNPFAYITDSYVPYQAIDTSDATDYTDAGISGDRTKQFNTASRGGYIYGKIKYGQDVTKNGGFPIGNSMVILAGKKICKPVIESSYTITDTDFDMRDDYTSDDKNVPFATRFTIGVADCVIHLAPSYCCMGYNKIVIDQSTAGKLCTIYNSYDDQNTIFDGETLGVGVYELTCSCDLSAAEVAIPGTENYYTGRNDVWTVTKIG